MGAETKVNDLIDNALRRHPRRSTEAEETIKADLDGMIKDICSNYPFWFLQVTQDSIVPQNFPMSQAELEALTPIDIAGRPDVDYWLGRGWLRTNPGQETYELFAPFEIPSFDNDGDGWKAAKCSKPMYAKPMNLQGYQSDDLTIPSADVYNYRASYSTPGAPGVALFESGRLGDSIRFSPTPDKSMIIAVSWVLAEPLKYYLDPDDVDEDNYTHKMMQEYPEVVSYLIMQKAAEFFQDYTAADYYETQLYGAPIKKGSIMTGSVGGKVGNMKRDTISKSKQNTYDIPIYKGKRRQIGREGSFYSNGRRSRWY